MDLDSRHAGFGAGLGLVTASPPGGSVRYAHAAARRLLARVVAPLGAAVVMLGACAPPAASPIGTRSPTAPMAASPAAGTSAAPSAAQALPAATAVPVRGINVGMVNVGMTYLPHRIAHVQGFYREAGFDAELQVMQTTTLLAGLAAGEIAFADSGGSGIRAAATGLPVRMVGCHGVRPIYALVLAPGVQSARELEGKGFVINAQGDDTHVMARELIRKYGGDPGQVEYVGVGTSAARYAAVETGRVGGGILAATETIQAREAGLAVISSAEDLPLACNAGVVVTLAAIAERPQEVRAFFRAVLRSVQFMQGNRPESVRILAEWQQVDERQAGLAYDAANVSLSYSIDKADGQQAIENALDFAKQAGHVDGAVQLRDVADLSIYP